jgi:hypothetical protein
LFSALHFFGVFLFWCFGCILLTLPVLHSVLQQHTARPLALTFMCGANHMRQTFEFCIRDRFVDVDIPAGKALLGNTAAVADSIPAFACIYTVAAL